MLRIALVNMPFSSVYRPSLGLGLLKAALVGDGHEVDVFNFNLTFADMVGLDDYQTLANIPSSLIGEWVFAETLNGKGTCPHFLAGGDETGATQLPPAFRTMRDRAEELIDRCMNSADWGAFDLVGFTSVFEQTTASLSLAKRIREKHPAVKVALGGSNAESDMGFALLRAYPFLDVVCSGEGDHAFPAYIAGLDRGEDPDIRGIMRQGSDTKPSSTASIVKMDDLPLPDFAEYYDQFLATSFGAAEIAKTDIPFESSRGCWWGAKAHCTFCGLNGSNMTFRSKRADRVVDELLELKNRHGEHTAKFFAVDNIIDYRYFETLLPELRERDLHLDLFYETKANLSRDQVRSLRDARISKIQPGIESLSSSILKLMNKGVSALQNIQLLKLCKEFGVLPVWNIIYGLPGEEESEYERMAKLTPALAHLDPPTGFYRMRLDRFSPYFNDHEGYGITNVRPFAQYGEVHPALTDEHRFDLAYYFDFDYADRRDPDSYSAPMHGAIGDWRAHNGRSYLICEDRDEATYILNTRPEFRQELIVLEGLDRAIHSLLDRPRSFDQLCEKLDGRGLSVDTDQVRSRVEALRERGLLIGEDERYLNLAIKLGEYRPPDRVRAVFERAISTVAEKMEAA